jgi:hypothetical protein
MATEDDSAKETPADTAKETGTGAPIPEQFQSEVMELVDGCTTDEQLQFIHTCVNKKQSELNKSEPQASEYSADDEPKD